MLGRPKRRSLFNLRFFTLASLAAPAWLFPHAAWAQAGEDEPAAAPNKDEEEEEAEEAPRASAAVGVTAEGTTAADATPAPKPRAAAEEGAEMEAGWDGLLPSRMHLGWDGNAEMDVGYARYGYELATFQSEKFYDFRGRFVLGPVLQHDFDQRHYARVTGQLVAWMREEAQRYLVNADDVYFQFGRKGVWDVQLGRFFTWRVYHRGLGFDLYTLEDTGALKEPPSDLGQFGARMYEVNANFWREMAGKVAVHVYPVDVLGFELLGVYGSERTTNVLGARAAVDLNLKFLRVTGAAEYRKKEPSTDTVNPNGSDRTLIGFGGGAIVSVGPVELAANLAKSSTTSYQLNAMLDRAGTNDTTTFGGYLQVDPGTLLFQRSLIVGAGLNRTEQLLENTDFERHDQGAAYIAYPLGFNDAMVKLVLSKADLLFEDADENTGIVTARNSDMVAGRVRMSCSF